MLSLGGAEVDDVAAASAEAAEATLGRALSDPSVGHSFWLLTQLPLAAAASDFNEQLGRLGVSVPGAATLFDLGSALALTLEKARPDEGGNDLGTIARQSAVETVLSLVGQSLPGLFDPTAAEVQKALAAFGRSDRFSILARDFFSRLSRRSLEYFLSRELSNHIGPDRQFTSIAAHSEFATALEVHCRQASRIIDEFAAAWYGKRLRDRRPVSRADAAAFARIAFRKMRAELKRRRSRDA